ncbi:hypothetical protein K438DRAFT_1770117 [Mycena galopus ATCC 62051]|nr:hypothetical protein K438DRAFT_1770117 [Mycena galopus ATCC 62051]
MSDTMSMSMLTSTTSVPPSSVHQQRTLRERCGFTLSISFAPAFPNIAPKGHLGPTAGNIPAASAVASYSSSSCCPLPSPLPMHAWNILHEVSAVKTLEGSGLWHSARRWSSTCRTSWISILSFRGRCFLIEATGRHGYPETSLKYGSRTSTLLVWKF